MNPHILKAAFVVTLLGVAGCAQNPPPPTVQTAQVQAPNTSGDAVLVTDTVRVVSVDQKNRALTLRNSKGRTFTVTVGPEVQNFNKIRRGDNVVVQYYQSIAYSLSSPNAQTPPNSVASGVETAPPGNLPAGVAARQITVTGLVTAVDLTAHTVTLVNPKGGPQRTIQVLDPKRQQDLAAVKKGDKITATITEAVAISVEPQNPTRTPTKRR